MKKDDISRLIEEAAVKWCADNQFASHKDRGTSFIDGATLAVSLMQKEVEELVEALEEIRKLNDKFAEDAVMDWDGVQEIAYQALRKHRANVVRMEGK